ncbi:hypothetical protein DM02DRAFT_618009 [Periconia macrospinosa]|uniref:Uncharacterized protein n=1 Tax=Periconia macrospinosa TaxID=97972 RepID=A0A2V1DAV1_9PLEO|nr:hypothetical protein DM02DRAFT_618009 [Periconia macrospinosa]
MNSPTDSDIITHLEGSLGRLAFSRNVTIPDYIKPKILDNLMLHIDDRTQYQQHELELCYKRRKGWMAKLMLGNVKKCSSQGDCPQDAILALDKAIRG